jgi:hypothetical protein
VHVQRNDPTEEARNAATSHGPVQGSLPKEADRHLGYVDDPTKKKSVDALQTLSSLFSVSESFPPTLKTSSPNNVQYYHTQVRGPGFTRALRTFPRAGQLVLCSRGPVPVVPTDWVSTMHHVASTFLTRSSHAPPHTPQPARRRAEKPACLLFLGRTRRPGRKAAWLPPSPRLGRVRKTTNQDDNASSHDAR